MRGAHKLFQHLQAQWGQAPLRPRGQVLAEVVKGFLQLAVFGLGEAGFLAVYLIAVQVLLMLGLCQRLCAIFFLSPAKTIAQPHNLILSFLASF
jgi:hypothetical protein